MSNKSYELTNEELEKIRKVSNGMDDNIFRLLKFYQNYNMLYKSLIDKDRIITEIYDEQVEVLEYTNFTYIDIYFAQIIEKMLDNNIEEYSDLVMKSVLNCIKYKKKIKSANIRKFGINEEEFDRLILLLQEKINELSLKKAQYNNKTIKVFELQQSTQKVLKQYYIFAKKFNILLFDNTLNERDIVRNNVKLLSYEEMVDMF